MAAKNTLLRGSLEGLVLKTLSHGPRHGYAIARWLEEQSAEAIQVEEGSLYPALYRMERRGLLRSSWGRSELDRRAKFYELTPAGESRLSEHVAEWATFSNAVSLILAS